MKGYILIKCPQAGKEMVIGARISMSVRPILEDVLQHHLSNALMFWDIIIAVYVQQICISVVISWSSLLIHTWRGVYM